MAEANSPGLPGWISKRDGRLVPFDADKISQALFAATEHLGQPSAFLARELTESVLHFLALELGDAAPTSAHIAELVVKVVRELGQPALAQAYAERHLADVPPRRKKDLARREEITVAAPSSRGPAQFLDTCARQYSLSTIYSRDLVAAQEEGWLTLVGLEHPGELEGGVLDWPGREGRSLLAALVEARRRFGSFIALDGPEFALEPGPAKNRQIALFVRDLKDGLEATRLRALVNLNVPPPPWAWQPADSPLFQTTAPAADDREALLDAILEEILHQFPPGDPVRLDWHLSEHDFAGPGRQRLLLVLRRALEDGQVSFVFDRPQRPVALGEGLTRQHQAVLQVAGIHLAPLVEMPGVEGNIDLLLYKLANLARMAASAAAQKRTFLRGRKDSPWALRRGFLLDRARLAVIPVGLPGVVTRLTSQGLATGKQGLALAREIVQRLHECLLAAGRATTLDCVLDSPWWTTRLEGTGPLHSAPHLVGLTCGELTAPLDDQLRAGGILHQIALSGTLTLLLPPAPAPQPDAIADLLHRAWKKTDLVRVRLNRLARHAYETPDLLAAGGPEGH